MTSMSAENPRRRPVLVLLCGLPCSGKTTLARQIEATTGAVVFSPDDWMVELQVDLWDEPFRGRLEQAMWGLALEMLARGLSVVLDYGYWSRAERDEKRLAARQLGVDVELHYLDVPIEELLRRVEKRNGSGIWRNAAPITRGHLERWSEMLERPESTELALFDNPIRPVP
jgi:predicted kinase